jgi:hypothetical protein
MIDIINLVAIIYQIKVGFHNFYLQIKLGRIIARRDLPSGQTTLHETECAKNSIFAHWVALRPPGWFPRGRRRKTQCRIIPVGKD